MAIGAAAEEEGHLARDHVLARQRRHVPLDRELGRVQRQARDRPLQAQLFRHVAEQIVDRVRADHLQHLAAVGIGEGKIAHQAGFLMMKRRRT